MVTYTNARDLINDLEIAKDKLQKHKRYEYGLLFTDDEVYLAKREL